MKNAFVNHMPRGVSIPNVSGMRICFFFWRVVLLCNTAMGLFLTFFCLPYLQLIFSGEYTKAMSKDWHLGHFSCWQCDESLTGQRYVLRDEHPYCVKCYETVFANTCDDCNKIIGIDSKVFFCFQFCQFPSLSKSYN